MHKSLNLENRKSLSLFYTELLNVRKHVIFISSKNLFLLRIFENYPPIVTKSLQTISSHSEIKACLNPILTLKGGVK